MGKLKLSAIFYIFLQLLGTVQGLSDRIFQMELSTISLNAANSDTTCLMLYHSRVTGGVLATHLTFIPPRTVTITFQTPLVLNYPYLARSSIDIRLQIDICIGGSVVNRRPLDPFFTVPAHGLMEYSCDNCFSRNLISRISGDLRIIFVGSGEGARSGYINIHRKIFKKRQTENDQCCADGASSFPVDQCGKCIYRFESILDGRIYNRDRDLDSEQGDNQNIQEKFYFTENTREFFTDSRFSLRAHRQRGNLRIDDYREFGINGLFPYQRLIYTNYSGFYSALELTGFAQIVSFGGCGNFAATQCSFINSDVTRNLRSEIICANSRYNNPPFCDQDISPCTRVTCMNGGTCAGSASSFVCICLPGFFGNRCEVFGCDPTCLNSQCIGPNTCGPCVGGFEGRKCTELSCVNYNKCNRGNCAIKNNTRVCECDRKSFTGQFCQHECREACINGICSLNSLNTFCLCDDGFTGRACELISQRSRITFERSQNFIVAISLICLFGAISIAILGVIIVKCKSMSFFVKDYSRDKAVTLATSTIGKTLQTIAKTKAQMNAGDVADIYNYGNDEVYQENNYDMEGNNGDNDQYRTGEEGYYEEEKPQYEYLDI